MDREHYIKDMPKHIEKIRAQVARVDVAEPRLLSASHGGLDVAQ